MTALLFCLLFALTVVITNAVFGHNLIRRATNVFHLWKERRKKCNRWCSPDKGPHSCSRAVVVLMKQKQSTHASSPVFIISVFYSFLKSVAVFAFARSRAQGSSYLCLNVSSPGSSESSLLPVSALCQLSLVGARTAFPGECHFLSGQFGSHPPTAMPIRSGRPSSLLFYYHFLQVSTVVEYGPFLCVLLQDALMSGLLLLGVQLRCHHHGTSEKCPVKL